VVGRTPGFYCTQSFAILLFHSIWILAIHHEQATARIAEQDDCKKLLHGRFLNKFSINVLIKIGLLDYFDQSGST
jgi:hypothetical protein